MRCILTTYNVYLKLAYYQFYKGRRKDFGSGNEQSTKNNSRKIFKIFLKKFLKKFI